MRAYLQGGYFVVEIDPEEVEAFASTWPGSNLTTTAGKEFSFSAANGDLVDAWTVQGDRRASTESEDGSALLALSEDACLFGARTLELESVMGIRYPSEAVASPRP